MGRGPAGDATNNQKAWYEAFFITTGDNAMNRLVITGGARGMGATLQVVV